MFDHVGCNPDEESQKRQALSVLVTTVVLGALGTGFVAASAWLVQESFELLEDDTEMVEVVLADEVELSLPPLPPPPPLAPASSDPVDEIEPDELVEEVEVLLAPIDPRMATDLRPEGAEGGQEGGVEDGVVEGRVGGTDGGSQDGRLGRTRVFHHSELDVKRRPSPRYPDSARALGLGEQVCKARVLIDEKGVPYDVVVRDCPRAFHAETRRGILQWRWMPPRSGRERVKAQTLIVVRFVLSD